MKIQQKIEVNDGKVFASYIYTREKIREWFWLFIGEGEACPYFYLPVYRSYTKLGYYAMLTPIAPFGLVFIALYHAMFSFWKDCLFITSKWINIERIHQVRERYFNTDNK